MKHVFILDSKEVETIKELLSDTIEIYERALSSIIEDGELDFKEDLDDRLIVYSKISKSKKIIDKLNDASFLIRKNK